MFIHRRPSYATSCLSRNSFELLQEVQTPCPCPSSALAPASGQLLFNHAKRHGCPCPGSREGVATTPDTCVSVLGGRRQLFFLQGCHKLALQPLLSLLLICSACCLGLPAQAAAVLACPFPLLLHATHSSCPCHMLGGLLSSV